MQNKNLRTGLILASIAVAIGLGFVARLYFLGH
ncbi:cytochrome oxidase small assembly protein [Chitinimonas sp. PSY-7]